MMMQKRKIAQWLIVLVFFLASACGSQITPPPTPAAGEMALGIATVTPKITEPLPEPAVQTTPTADLTAVETEQVVETPSICSPTDQSLPVSLKLKLLDMINHDSAPDTDEPCTTIIPGDDHLIGQMVLTLVAPFPTVTDEIETVSLKSFWQTGDNTFIDRLLVYPYGMEALTWLWGEPKGTVELMPHTVQDIDFADIQMDMIKEAWISERTWAIVAFDELHPRWKVIALDGQSPIQKSFDPETYALTIPLTLYNENPTRLERSFEYFAYPKFEDLMPFSNYNSERLTTVILTGVTAMVRATAVGMDERGIQVPGEDLADVLKEADILHISNEVPFAENCPKHYRGNYLVFCTPESYMDLLRSIGTDVVELTGDHFQDYGPEAMLYTLELYAKEGWPVYGGGKDIFDAREPVKMEVNGNKIAFLGCNAKSPNFAQASETSTGAYHCDMDYMAETVRELRSEGYLPIVTFQHEERYEWSPNAQMIRDFGIVLEAGAVIASGSQAHQPHYAEFVHDGFAHYGLGNLFFDQYGIADYTDWAFIDRHVFYNGRHISTEILTIRFLDLVKPTWATPEQRIEMLETLFDTARMWWPGEEPWRKQ